MTYSITEIRDALHTAKNGKRPAEDDELGQLAWEFAGGNVYRITLDDIESHVADNENLTDEQKSEFADAAKNYIEKAETFGESLQICLELAMDDIAAET